ncbi:hypothetical protein ACFS7Z_14065 [Pontibacter toksunensis]|uniref:Glycosyl transferase family 11 n=1 Tax=Pontibacter toksunensis TaxID=1332631 RepID=A0ABW6BWJ6_9BACT
MIVLRDHPGRLCNRLWSYVPFISFCLKHGQELLILHFDRYYDLFDDLEAVPGIRLQKHHTAGKLTLGSRLLHRVIPKLPEPALRFTNIYSDKDFWENERWSSALPAHKTHIYFKSGVEHLQKSLFLPEHHEKVRLLFRPRQAIIYKIAQQLEEQRTKHQVVVGVHIRRSDYRWFKRGAYYFQDSTYYNYMAALETELQAAGKSVSFLLSSDEKLNQSHFKGLNTFQISNSVDVEDLYALSLTDYIIGVPSTFSMWASFYGKVPLRILQFEDEKISLNQFSVIVAQDVFENGERFTHHDWLNKSTGLKGQAQILLKAQNSAFPEPQVKPDMEKSTDIKYLYMQNSSFFKF